AFYWKQEIEKTNNILLNNTLTDGKQFTDGSYTLQVTPVYHLTADQKEQLQSLRANNDQDAIAAFRADHNLPSEVNVYTVNFGVRDGKFVTPDQKEAQMDLPTMSGWNPNHPSLYASLNPIVSELPAAMVKDNTPTGGMDDQVFLDDVIVSGGSICVGFDCVNGESFGSDTQILKENNLRLYFNDTSNSASFPSNDWRLTANDQTNGGNNYFAISDATAGNNPFLVEAGAGANALYVDSNGGNVGMGTATPIVELHVTDGDTPTLRLEQNGSNGWTPQTWDVAGNETNFFIRDVNNSSNLILRLRAGAPANSIFVQNNGNIGLGNDSPTERLHLKTGNILLDQGNTTLTSGNLLLSTGELTVTEGNVTFQEGDISIPEGQLGIGKEPTTSLDVMGISQFEGSVSITGTSTFRGNMSALNSTGASTVFHVDHTNSRVGIGTNGPNHLLELSQNDAVKPGGGDWSAPSDRRLKTNIKDYTDGLSTVMSIRPVTYNYNGKMDLPTDEEFVGVIAQDIQKVAPYMIKDLNPSAKEGEEKYLAVDNTAMTYMLINAVQEQQQVIDAQQAKIDALQGQLADLNALKAQVAALAEMVQSADANTSEEGVESISEDRK
ncbi:MAG: tail fiber domain-containing protein, partial [Bacteroidota bacterium]